MGMRGGKSVQIRCWGVSFTGVNAKNLPDISSDRFLSAAQSRMGYTPRVAQAVTTSAANEISSGQPSHQVSGG